MRILTGIWGAVFEAWSELRVHRGRVFLSLLGVLIAVCALTVVTGFGNLVRQTNQEFYDRISGPAESFSASYVPGSGEAGNEEMREQFEEALQRSAERYGITYLSRQIGSDLRVQLPGGVQDLDVTGVDPQYGDMRRVRVAEGTWFRPGDEQLLAPVVVVSDSVWQAIGAPDLRTHPTIEITAPIPATAVIIGVLPPLPSVASQGDEPPPHTAYMLADPLRGIEGDAEQLPPEEDDDEEGASTMTVPRGTSYVMWLPEGSDGGLSERLESDLRAAMGAGVTVSFERTDLYKSGEDPMATIQVLVSIVSSIVLTIGVVGYVNLSIVTVRQRIREIGIRRSFGATSGRVFFSVLMESVVGTTLAGVIGIGIALLVLENPDVQQGITYGTLPSEAVPFPTEAALMGLFVSVGAGLLAGVIPALIATRVRVIDAIRTN